MSALEANDPIFGDPNIDAAPPIWNPFTSSDDDVLDDESAPNIDLEFIVDIWEDGPHSLNYRMTGTVDFVTHGAFDSPEALLEHAVSFEQRACVWHGALPLAIKLEDGSRGKKGDVSRSLRWLFADLDWKHADAHADSNKLPTEAVVRAVTESFKPMPTHVIDSGHGLQVYWKLDRAVDHAEWDETAKRLKSMLVAAGITSPDRVTDRASVLRVPGTWNMKPDCEPVMVKVLESTGAEHSPETFKQAAPAPTAERERVAPPAATQSVSKHSQTEESPAAFIRRDGDGVTFTALLERHGFIIGDNLGNEGIDVTRPGKVGGTSGRVHTDIHGGQFLNLFTPNGPAELYTVGKPGDGDPVCRSLSKWDAFVALEYGGDATAAGRAVRQQMNSNRSNISTTGLEFNDIDDRGDRGDLPAPVDWEALFAGDTDHEWLVEDVWPLGRQLHIFAAKKTGKSLLMLWIAANLAYGRDPFTGRRQDPQRVTYLDYEMTEDDIRERLEEMGFTADQLKNLRYYLHPPIPPLDTSAGGAALLALAQRDESVAVVLDTVSRVIQGEENSNDTFRNFYRHTGMRLKAAGIGLARLDHEGHDGGRSRGASAKADDVDVVWRLTKSDDGLTLTRTVARMSWIAERVDIQMKTEPLLFVRTDDSWPAGTRDKAAELDRLGLPTEVTRRAAIDALKSAGITPGKTTVISKAIAYRKHNISILELDQVA